MAIIAIITNHVARTNKKNFFFEDLYLSILINTEIRVTGKLAMANTKPIICVRPKITGTTTTMAFAGYAAAIVKKRTRVYNMAATNFPYFIYE